MGFAEKDEFATICIQKHLPESLLSKEELMENDQQKILQIIKKLGFDRLNDFFFQEIQTFIAQEINEWQDKIEAFEKKYKINCEQLHTHFHQIIEYDELEKEEDEVEWEMAIAFVKAHQKTLNEFYD